MWLGMGSRSAGMNCGYPICHGSPSQVPIAMIPADMQSAPARIAGDRDLGDFEVAIGTSRMAKGDKAFVSRIVNFSDKCEREVLSRLAYGDAGSERANRVMHVALINGVPIGWCSSSTCSCSRLRRFRHSASTAPVSANPAHCQTLQRLQLDRCNSQRQSGPGHPLHLHLHLHLRLHPLPCHIAASRGLTLEPINPREQVATQ